MRITKASPTHLVILASFASTVTALDFVRKVSAPPAIAPERPERLPDWSKTTLVRNKQVRSWSIVRMVFSMVFNPFNEKETCLFNSYSCKANNNTMIPQFQEDFIISVKSILKIWLKNKNIALKARL